jgi:hypothetical protein
MGPVQTGLKKGRDTRKISDMTQTQGALIQYAGDNNGEYPVFLTSLDPTYMKTDAKFLGTSAARDRFMYTVYADAAGNVVSYHMGVTLENQNASLQTDADCGFKDATGDPTSAIQGIPASHWDQIDSSVLLTQTDTGVAPNPIQNSTSTCGDIPNGFLTNTNFTGNGAGNPAVGASTTDFGGAGSQEGAQGVCTSKMTTCIYDVVPR